MPEENASKPALRGLASKPALRGLTKDSAELIMQDAGNEITMYWLYECTGYLALLVRTEDPAHSMIVVYETEEEMRNAMQMNILHSGSEILQNRLMLNRKLCSHCMGESFVQENITCSVCNNTGFVSTGRQS